MAPEQALSTKHADARADIYSLGCSLHYLLTGRTAYDGDSLMAKLLAHREQPIPFLGSEVPDEVQAVFQKMVAKKFEDRYQSMSEVVVALEHCSSNQQTAIDINAAATIVQNDPLARTTTDTGRIENENRRGLSPFAESSEQKGTVPLSAVGSRKKLILGAVGVGCLAVAVAVAIFIKMHTKDGTDNPRGSTGAGAPSPVSPGTAASVVAEQKGTVPLSAQSNEPWNTPAFQQWRKDVAALPTEKQVEAVVKKLRELNPGFDGKETHELAGGAVTELRFVTDNVADISPVRALERLKTLSCNGTWDKRKLEDLSPLRGLKLTFLNCSFSKISDLSPLEGMPLVELWCNHTLVSNLSPLRDMPLTRLHIDGTAVSDLSPLKGMPLGILQFNETPVSDLTPLEGMHLLRVWLTPRNITRGMDVLRQMKSVRFIGVRVPNPLTAEEFWKKYDAGDFGKPNRRAAKSAE